MIVEPDVVWEAGDAEGHVRTPFSISSVRKVLRQSLVSVSGTSGPVRHGLTEKSAVLLSVAAGAFLERLASDVRRLSPSSTGRITRRQLVRVLIAIPRYRFAITRLRTTEVFPFLAGESAFSHRIARAEVERAMRFPIEFVAPYTPGNPHALDDREVSRREAENVEAAIKALVLAHHAYAQAIPEFLRPDSYVV
jgi:hypothetical protein